MTSIKATPGRVTATGTATSSTAHHQDHTGLTGALTLGLAVLAALIGWLAVRAVVGDPLRVAFDGTTQQVAIGQVLIASTVAGLAGWGSLRLLQRLTARGTTIWRVLATAVLLLSFAGPLSAEATTATKVGLVALHVLVGAILIGGLPRRR